MKKKLEVCDQKALHQALGEELSRSGDARYLHRLHCVCLVGNGFSCYQAARLFSVSPRAVERWVHQVNESGVEGLRERERTGRQPHLTDENLGKLGKEIQLSPQTLGYDQEKWDGRLLSTHIALCYRVELGTRQCQRILKQNLQKPISSGRMESQVTMES